ncbi:hypothetical protein ACFRMN_08370 [Streptomyces sp. NPDC056835]|uniref:hypothetical protein n=1 Tax=Streptomyces sp. NPDC056835 TaxID=3345956 RepID=UPI0036B4594E
MGEGVSVCCPSCGSRHTLTASVYPCVCGARVAPTLSADARVEAVTRRAWADEWVTVRCAACAREDQWPRPELGCPCGAMLRIAVEPVTPEAVPPEPAAATPEQVAPAPGPPPVAAKAPESPAPGPPSHIPLPRTAASPRPGFRPVTIRTAHDAVTTAALYLRWLGFKSVVESGEPSAPAIRTPGFRMPGIGLRGPDVVAQVDPTTSPASLRSVECLWLNGMNASATSVYFSLAGYADDARARADALRLPLFVLDLTGAPQPVNGPADELVSSGA